MRLLVLRQWTILLLFVLGLNPLASAGIKDFFIKQKDKIQKAAQIKIFPIQVNNETLWQKEITIDSPSLPDLFKFVTVPFPLVDMGSSKTVSMTFKKIYSTQEEASNITNSLEILKKIPFTAGLLNSTLNVGESFQLTNQFDVSAGLKSPQLFGLAPIGANGGQELKGKLSLLVRKISETQIELYIIREHQQGQKLSSSVGSQISEKSLASLNIAGVKLSSLNPQFLNFNRSQGTLNSAATGFKVDLNSQVGQNFYNRLMSVTFAGDDLMQAVHLEDRSFLELEKEKQRRRKHGVSQTDLAVISGQLESQSRNLGYLNRTSLSKDEQNIHLKFRDENGLINNYLMDETTFLTDKKKLFGFWATHKNNLSLKALYAASASGKAKSLVGFEFSSQFSSTSESKKEYKIWLDSVQNFIPDQVFSQIKSENWFDSTTKFAPRLSVSAVLPRLSFELLSQQINSLSPNDRQAWFENQIITYMENRKWPNAGILRRCWNQVCRFLNDEQRAAAEVHGKEVARLAKRLNAWIDPELNQGRMRKEFLAISKSKLFAAIGPGLLSQMLKDTSGELLKTEVSLTYYDQNQKYHSKQLARSEKESSDRFQDQKNATAYFDYFTAADSKYAKPLAPSLQCQKVFDASL
jgi:hypothetical protein